MQQSLKRKLSTPWKRGLRSSVFVAAMLTFFGGANDWLIYLAELSDERTATHVMLAGGAASAAGGSGTVSTS